MNHILAPLLRTKIPTLALLGVLASGFLACGRVAVCDIDIPAGSASHTLKEFARQARVEIVFDARSVGDVVTNGVRGRLAPDKALERMLRGTPLVAAAGGSPGAFAITKRTAALAPPPASLSMIQKIRRIL